MPSIYGADATDATGYFATNTSNANGAADGSVVSGLLTDEGAPLSWNLNASAVSSISGITFEVVCRSTGGSNVAQIFNVVCGDDVLSGSDVGGNVVLNTAPNTDLPATLSAVSIDISSLSLAQVQSIRSVQITFVDPMAGGGQTVAVDSITITYTAAEPKPDPEPQPEPKSSFMTTINMQALAGKPSWFQIPIDYLLFKQAEPFGKFRVADLPKRCAIERIVWEPLVAFGGGSVTTPTIAITDDQLASIVSSLNLNTGGNVFATVTAPIDFDSDRYIYIDPALGGGTFANVDRGSGILHVLVSAIPERIVN